MGNSWFIQEKSQTTSLARRESQGMGGSELASGEGTKQWLEEMWQEAETS